MPALLIADIEVTDAAGSEEYQRRVPAYVAAYDGRFIVRGGRSQTLEGSWQAHRVVVIEFPSMTQLLAFYDSAEYATLKSLRMHASDSRIIAVDEAAAPAGGHRVVSGARVSDRSSRLRRPAPLAPERPACA